MHSLVCDSNHRVYNHIDSKGKNVMIFNELAFQWMIAGIQMTALQHCVLKSVSIFMYVLLAYQARSLAHKRNVRNSGDFGYCRPFQR